MTAKETAFKHMPKKFTWEVNRKGETDCDEFVLLPEWIEQAMSEYARIKCKEQRELCAKELFNKEGEDVCQIVRLSPEPTFE